MCSRYRTRTVALLVILFIVVVALLLPRRLARADVPLDAGLANMPRSPSPATLPTTGGDSGAWWTRVIAQWTNVSQRR